MKIRAGIVLAALLGVTGCAERPQLVMLNPRTGALVGCPVPDMLSGSGQFLVSRACLSACSAHGFRPVPGAETKGSDDETPSVCLN
jgi:hypothetical protein